MIGVCFQSLFIFFHFFISFIEPVILGRAKMKITTPITMRQKRSSIVLVLSRQRKPKPKAEINKKEMVASSLNIAFFNPILSLLFVKLQGIKICLINQH